MSKQLKVTAPDGTTHLLSPDAQANFETINDNLRKQNARLKKNGALEHQLLGYYKFEVVGTDDDFGDEPTHTANTATEIEANNAAKQAEMDAKQAELDKRQSELEAKEKELNDKLAAMNAGGGEPKTMTPEEKEIAIQNAYKQFAVENKVKLKDMTDEQKALARKNAGITD